MTRSTKRSQPQEAANPTNAHVTGAMNASANDNAHDNTPEGLTDGSDVRHANDTGAVVDAATAQSPTQAAIFAGEVDFGTGPVDCFATDAGVSLLTTRGIVRILTGADDGHLGRIASRIPLETGSFSLGTNTRFRLPRNNVLAKGYPASVLMDLCDAILDARENGLLRADQQHLADRAQKVVRATARRGLDAMIWEATGYEKFKEAGAHQRRLLLWMRGEPAPWDKLFPDDFYLALARLFRITKATPGKRPPVFGAFTAEYVYRWFDDHVCPGAYQELVKQNPDPTAGTRHHQFLTDAARRAVAEHIRIITALINVSGTADDFRMRFNANFKGGALQLPLAVN